MSFYILRLFIFSLIYEWIVFSKSLEKFYIFIYFINHKFYTGEWVLVALLLVIWANAAYHLLSNLICWAFFYDWNIGNDNQLQEAEKKLLDSEAQLGRLRSKDNPVSTRNPLDNGIKNVKVERRSTSPLQLPSRPELSVSVVNPKISQPVKLVDSGTRARSPVLNHAHGAGKAKWDKSHGNSSEQEIVELQDKGTKRKFGNSLTHWIVSLCSWIPLLFSGPISELIIVPRISEAKEHKELITSIATSSSPVMVCCNSSSHISSQHKRKLRSLVLCPVNNQLFATRYLFHVIFFV